MTILREINLYVLYLTGFSSIWSGIHGYNACCRGMYHNVTDFWEISLNVSM